MVHALLSSLYQPLHYNNSEFLINDTALSTMDVWFLTTIALLLALYPTDQAACSPCPFQWMEYQNHCYRYFTEYLSYDEAESFCQHQTYTPDKEPNWPQSRAPMN